MITIVGVKLVQIYFNSSDQHAAIKSRMLKLPDGLWNCAECGYTTSYNTTMWKHIEAKKKCVLLKMPSLLMFLDITGLRKTNISENTQYQAYRFV